DQQQGADNEPKDPDRNCGERQPEDSHQRCQHHEAPSRPGNGGSPASGDAHARNDGHHLDGLYRRSQERPACDGERGIAHVPATLTRSPGLAGESWRVPPPPASPGTPPTWRWRVGSYPPPPASPGTPPTWRGRVGAYPLPRLRRVLPRLGGGRL